MFSPAEYELLDFGAGRKLERFGPLVLDRPSPAAEGEPLGDPALWSRADGVFRRIGKDTGKWAWSGTLPDPWHIRHGDALFRLKPTDFGHVGLFPEQAENWDFIRERVRRAGRAIKVLNLFAYTGGSTLAAALAGAEVTHVDAAKNVVRWARENARLSGLEQHPIRWIDEDAVKFVDREIRRENYYDGVILDPPSYGHGPKGQTWKLSQNLTPLLAACAELVRRRPAFLVVTCHTPGFGSPVLEAMLSETMFGACGQGVLAKGLSIATSTGRRLPAGVVARWPA